ncbi:MAG: D-alanine-D-alanine ligase [Moorella sp. (in: firmicutes)]|jgi:D-alanine-D-alanine ligase|uniref:D-alanine--D-alanine ligase n=1 Tax=unclassified Neomoorella TaxID=2676739 RepID=UPI0010FFBF5C|nr:MULTISPECIES: D-alanine--D-alanine ligase [unclassified Moorella (in: firmicutes)]MDK2815388.1 D-alanine-D-alanine ligase [Moorella sp. (in: firmicutes)]GEA15342.1 D-alanine--D-alanine ligase [Moorella sp. E308F]GEA19797.1 D-alanine--D-alanine ligase [Moorella sp. E306M]
MKIAVLMGGPSSEREISLKSGAAVAAALEGLGHEVKKIDLDEEVVAKLKAFAPDVVFNALHGKPGEDGSVQGLLEILGIPYTGSRVLASAITMDKIMTKRILRQAGLPTPDFLNWTAAQYASGCEEVKKRILKDLGLPVVIKAPTQGSTIGTFIVREEGELATAIEGALKYDPCFMAEAFLPGPEITAAVLGNSDPLVLPLIEIVSHTGFYDYTAKYTPGLSDHIIPPRLPEAVLAAAASLARQAYILLGCRGFARVDMIVAGGQSPQVIEVNSVPGMTATSLVPDAARAAGLDFPTLVQKIVELALEA